MAKSNKSEETKNTTKTGGKNVAKAKGWFSARHETDEAHKATQLDRKIRSESKANIALANAELAAKRTPEEQLALLDARLGLLMGAKKERAKLHAQLTVEQRAAYIKYVTEELKKLPPAPSSVPYLNYIDGGWELENDSLPGWTSGAILCFAR